MLGARGDRAVAVVAMHSARLCGAVRTLLDRTNAGPAWHHSVIQSVERLGITEEVRARLELARKVEVQDKPGSREEDLSTAQAKVSSTEGKALPQPREDALPAQLEMWAREVNHISAQDALEVLGEETPLWVDIMHDAMLYHQPNWVDGDLRPNLLALPRHWNPDVGVDADVNGVVVLVVPSVNTPNPAQKYGNITNYCTICIR